MNAIVSQVGDWRDDARGATRLQGAGGAIWHRVISFSLGPKIPGPEHAGLFALPSQMRSTCRRSKGSGLQNWSSSPGFIPKIVGSESA